MRRHRRHGSCSGRCRRVESVLLRLESERFSEYANAQVRIWFAIFVSACWCGGASQGTENAAPSTGVFGRVLDADTHEVVRRTDVKVYTSKEQRDEFTDSEGRFRFPDLAPGDYGLVAHRDGYTDRAYKLERADFEAQKELVLELHRQGVITGRVASPSGQPLQGARIEALGFQASGGNRNVLGSAESDDLGDYRLSGLDPGTYVVRVTYQEGRSGELDPMPLMIATAWYGKADSPTDVRVNAGSVSTGVDFAMDPVLPVTVRGTLRTEAGTPVDRATLWVIGNSGEGGHNASAENGNFEVSDLGAGTYTISARTFDQTQPLFGRATVEIHGVDPASVEIILRPVPRIEGQIRFENGESTDVKPGALFFLRSDRNEVDPLGMQMGQPGPDGKFSVALVPGEYRLSYDNSASHLAVRKITLDEKPVTDWTIRIGQSAGTSKLLVVLGPEEAP